MRPPRPFGLLPTAGVRGRLCAGIGELKLQTGRILELIDADRYCRNRVPGVARDVGKDDVDLIIAAAHIHRKRHTSGAVAYVGRQNAVGVVCVEEALLASGDVEQCGLGLRTARLAYRIAIGRYGSRDQYGGDDDRHHELDQGEAGAVVPRWGSADFHISIAPLAIAYRPRSFGRP